MSVPQAGSDGEVIDIALHTVKVQNWDKTISTIPTNKFISESFKNWRGMSESGGRRIKRSLRLDMNSVRFLNEHEIDELSRRELLRDHMRGERRRDHPLQRGKGRGQPGGDPGNPAPHEPGHLPGLRAEIPRGAPEDAQGDDAAQRASSPRGPEGVPIEIYCFSNDTAWANYEGFQADIFDHLIATLPEFGLRPFQAPGGSDFRKALGGRGREG